MPRTSRSPRTTGRRSDALDADERRFAALEDTMERLARTCRECPPDRREHLGNALLNLSLGYLLEQHGPAGTVGILARVADALATDALPDCPGRALDVLRVDA